MNKQVFLQTYNAACALGLNSNNIFAALKQNKTGIKNYSFQFEEEKQIPLGKFPTNSFKQSNEVVDFNALSLHYISQICKESHVDLKNKDNLLILATTKGNIHALHSKPENAPLHKTLQFLETKLKLANKPYIISNACISGMEALIHAHDLVKAGLYKQVVVCAADVLSPFVISGFNVLQAMDYTMCKPYDANRKGVNLGEACAVAIVSEQESEIEILGGNTSNDANHISGPSRDGSGLALAINKTLEQTQVKSIDLINAHGTATLFNDEMECKAFSSLQMQDIPLNSLKAYVGHTLGAAGLLEIILCAEMMKNNLGIQSLQYEENGLSQPLNILEKNLSFPIKTLLKTASGFGGCNAALILQKNG